MSPSFFGTIGYERRMGMDDEKLKDAYISSGMSLKELAELFHTSYSHVKKLSQKEGWAKARREKRQKIQKAFSDAFGKEGKNFTRMMQYLWILTEASLFKVREEDVDAQDVKQLISNVKELKALSQTDESAADIGKLETLMKGLMDA